MHARAAAVLPQLGRGGGQQAVGTPRLRLFCRSWGGGKAFRQLARPGCGRSALAGAGEKIPGSKDAPAVAGVRQPRLGGRADRYMHTPDVAVLG